jgi:S1/P1 Nuclease
MPSRNRLFAGVLLGLLATASPILAFHERGHMAIVLIAYRQLDDAHKLQMQSLLKAHPHYAEFLTSAMPSDARADEWIVMQASVWPDWVKKNYREPEKGFNFPNHHYVNIPIKRLEGLNEETVKQLEQNAANLPKDENSGRILVEYPHWLETYRNPSLDPAKRAIALCWVFHLLGDIHQPLHAATLFTRNTPKGDLGGNLSFVKWQSRPQNLHFIWDGMAGWGELQSPTMSQYTIVDMMTRDFLQRYQISVEERSVLSMTDWAKESTAIAERDAYSFNGKPLDLVFTAKMGEQPAIQITPALPEGYGARARQIAERRVVLAGHRLANIMAETSVPNPAPSAP